VQDAAGIALAVAVEVVVVGVVVGVMLGLACTWAGHPSRLSGTDGYERGL